MVQSMPLAQKYGPQTFGAVSSHDVRPLAGPAVASKKSFHVLISVVMTVGVYGMVAGLVKIDDLGEYLALKGGPRARSGMLLVQGTPWLMKGISIVGTLAMLMVGGHILIEGVPPLHHLEVELIHGLPFEWLLSSLAGATVGGVAGLLTIGALALWSRLKRK